MIRKPADDVKNFFLIDHWLVYWSLDLIVSEGDNGCTGQHTNGGCSHLCFGAPGGQRTCGCPDGMRLQRDQTVSDEDL